MTEKKYIIYNISRLRMGTDGQGVRTLILLGGCPLKCRYCINPFTWDGSEAFKEMTASEIHAEVSKDDLYLLATSGGVTFGGGEPLLQPELINEYRRICDPELTIYVETSLNIPPQNVQVVASVVDHFYVDIKTLDPDIYREYTKGELQPVLDNLLFLLREKGSDSVTVRIPLIPRMTDEDSQKWSCQELKKMGVTMFDLFTYILR